MIIDIHLEIDSILIWLLLFNGLLCVIYSCIDVNYFATMIFLSLWCKYVKKKVRADGNTNYYDICTTNDIDIYLNHMNNARYLRSLDFARIHFYKRTGLYSRCLKSRGVFQTATNIRYRRAIPLFAPYKIVTKMIYWDENDIYLEHQFITLNDGFVSSIAICKQRVLGLSVNEIVNSLLENDKEYRPKPPIEIEEWIKLNQYSSDKMRKTANLR